MSRPKTIASSLWDSLRLDARRVLRQIRVEAPRRRPARAERRNVILVSCRLIVFILVHMLVLFLLFFVDIWNPEAPFGR